MIKTTKTITLYNLDNSTPASDWVKTEIKGLPTMNFPPLSSAINSRQKDGGRLVENNLGNFISMSNNVYYNATNVSLMSSSFSHKGTATISVTPLNFHKVVALFTARRTIKRDWINWQDEYSAPNTDHEDYEQWNNDAIVYALFNTKSNQSSLRNVDYQSQQWDITNEFFFMSSEVMKEFADANSYSEMYNDVKQQTGERFVYNKLKQVTLSEDAQEILDFAKEMVRKTFPYRSMMNEEHPNYNLQSWDAGWYQIKLIMKEYFKDELKEFSAKYKAFEDRMREGVYEFEFLRK